MLLINEAHDANRPTEDALLECVSYYLANYEGRGVPGTIIREMHATLLPDFYDAGNYRQIEVEIVGASITPAETHQIGWLMHDAMEALRTALEIATSEEERLEGIVVFFHRFNAIHPFRDGNGRVSRATLHLLLRQQGILEAQNDFYDVFALRRDEYLASMKEADNGNARHLYWLITVGLFDAILKDFLDRPITKDLWPKLPESEQAWGDSRIRAATPLDHYLRRGAQFYEAWSKVLRGFANEANLPETLNDN